MLSRYFSVAFVLVLIIGSFAYHPLSARAQALPPTTPLLMDTSLVPAITGIKRVATPQNVQRVINEASLGDEITLQTGVVYPPIRLPKKTGNGWIVIRTEKDPVPSGTRVSFAQSALMARIVADKGPAITTENGAHHYWITGIEIKPGDSVSSNRGTLIVIGDNDAMTPQASYIVLDRLYIHGHPEHEWRRGISMNSAYTAVINSYIAEIHTKTYKDASTPRKEAQGIASWNGPGPYQIRNNYISASTEGVLFGGDTSCAAGMVPADIEVSYNHFHKPKEWKTTAIPHWWVKNHLEFKSAKRVVVNNNIFENVWRDSAGDQKGAAVVINPENQTYGDCDGSVTDNPWSEVSDVRFVNNKIINAGGGINISAGGAGNNITRQTKHIRIANNLFYGTGERNVLSADTGGNGWGDGHLFKITSNKRFGVDSLVIENNTAFQNAAIIVADDRDTDTLSAIRPHTNVIVQNNIINRDDPTTNKSGFSGIDGSDVKEGAGIDSSFNVYFPGIVFRQNVILNAGADTASRYAHVCSDHNKLGCNFFGVDPQFVNKGGSNFTLAGSSPFKNKSTYYFTGIPRDIGAWNWASLAQAGSAPLGTVGISTAPPTPQPLNQPFVFQRNLSIGMIGNDVRELQKFLTKNGFTLAVSGPGSPGHETTYFGPLTRAALTRFQISRTILERGFAGPQTRAVLNR